MKKSTKIMKKLLALFLVVLMSIDGFAAVVSDNDGSAFITKAEYDSLKNNFQSQLDKYNSSIDNRIDYTIASYLAGLIINQDPDNLWQKIEDITNSSIRFLNGYPGTGVEDCRTETTLNITRQYNIKRNRFYYGFVGRNVTAAGDSNSIGFKFQICYSSDTGVSWDYSILSNLVNAVNGTLVGRTGWDADFGYKLAETSSVSENGSASAVTNIQDGNGCVWLYEELPSGHKQLRSYNLKFYPVQNMNVSGHSYKDWYTTNKNDFKTRYTTASGLDITSSIANLSFTMPEGTKPGFYSDYSERRSRTSTTNGTWGDMTLSIVKENDGIDYTSIQFGNIPTDGKIWCLDEQENFVLSTLKTVTGNPVLVAEEYPSPSGPASRNVSYNAVTTKYYQVSYKPRNEYINSFSNQYLSSVAGEQVFLGGGAPLFKTFGSDEKIRCKIKFHLENETGAATSGDVIYSISNKQFINGLSTGSSYTPINNQSVTVESSGTEVEFTIDSDNPQTWWINMYPVNDGNRVYITNSSFKI